MWTYSQLSGQLWDYSGTIIGVGYAGNGAGKNNPDMQDVRDVGPLPVGFYAIGEPIDDAQVGKYALPLYPDPANEMYGRSAFFMHGDSQEHPGQASDGCIVQMHDTRVQVATSGDRKLQVISGLTNNYEDVQDAALGEG